jgi:hypothetical protein
MVRRTALCYTSPSSSHTDSLPICPPKISQAQQTHERGEGESEISNTLKVRANYLARTGDKVCVFFSFHCFPVFHVISYAILPYPNLLFVLFISSLSFLSYPFLSCPSFLKMLKDAFVGSQGCSGANIECITFLQVGTCK